MSVKVSFKSNWSANEVDKLDRGVLEMATDIHRKSAILAPKDKSNLVNSGRIKRNDKADYSVIYGGTNGVISVPYALRRHFENKKNPQTLGYLEKAADAVARGSISKYFRG